MLSLIKTFFAGVMGGITVYYIPRFLRAWKSSQKPVLTYYFFDHKKNGEEPKRRISHSYGKLIEDSDATKGKVWEHTSEQLEAGGLATCYGPYTKEISERGKYKARFRVKACGINTQDQIILTLDIAYGTWQGTGPIVVGLPLMEKDLKGCDFNDGKYCGFDLDFDYDGQHLLEFRCLVKDPETYTQRVQRLIFDNVSIYRIYEIL